MNYIKKVAELLNVEVGEHFTIHFKKEKRQIKNFYLNEEKGLMIKTGGSDVKANSSFVEGILTGTLEIKRTRKKWKYLMHAAAEKCSGMKKIWILLHSKTSAWE